MEGRLGYVLPAVAIYGTYSDGSNYESGSGSNYEFYSYFGGYTQVLTLNHNDAINFMNDMQSGYNDLSTLSGLASSLHLSFIPTSLALFLTGRNWSETEKNYLNQSSQNGIEITIVHMIGTTGATLPQYSVKFLP